MSISKELYNNLLRFDWFRYKNNNRLSMLQELYNLHAKCNLCELCKSNVIYRSAAHDPHVFSNMCSQKVMIVCLHPDNRSASDNVLKLPHKLESLLCYFGLHQDDFYVTSLVKCCPGDDIVLNNHVEKCQPYLSFELGIINPKLVVVYDKNTHNHISNKNYNDGIKKIVYSDKINRQIYSLDLDAPDDVLKEQVKTLCSLTKMLSNPR